MVVRLAVLDVDGVLTMFRSAWQYLHGLLGLSEWARVNSEAYRRGLIDYRDWALVDALLWFNVPRRWTRPMVTLRPGALELLQVLKRGGVRVLAVSGGLDYVQDVLGGLVDLYLSNRLIYVEDALFSVTVDVENKNPAIELVEREGVRWDEVLAIGDGENDIPILRLAKYSVAFNPVNEDVANAANIVIDSPTLYPVIDAVKQFLDHV
jgi:phosphoserine phosphatase